MLSVGVHATDFDDEYSREHLDFIMVNGHQVNSLCDPMASGCGDTTPAKDRKLYPCVTDYLVSNTLVNDGTFNISGKLNDMVDECPVEGNLLSGLAMVGCFVRPIPPPLKLQDPRELVLGNKEDFHPAVIGWRIHGWDLATIPELKDVDLSVLDLEGAGFSLQTCEVDSDCDEATCFEDGWALQCLLGH